MRTSGKDDLYPAPGDEKDRSLGQQPKYRDAVGRADVDFPVDDHGRDEFIAAEMVAAAGGLMAAALLAPVTKVWAERFVCRPTGGGFLCCSAPSTLSQTCNHFETAVFAECVAATSPRNGDPVWFDLPLITTSAAVVAGASKG